MSTNWLVDPRIEGFCALHGQQEAFARVLVRECLMGTPGLYARVIGAEAPLVGGFETIVRQGMETGELRTDIGADVLALSIAGLMDLALARHWATDGASPRLDEIPSIVLTLLLDPPPAVESG